MQTEKSEIKTAKIKKIQWHNTTCISIRSKRKE